MRNSKITILGMITTIQKEEIKYTSLALILQKKKVEIILLSDALTWPLGSSDDALPNCREEWRNLKGTQTQFQPATALSMTAMICVNGFRITVAEIYFIMFHPSISMLPVLQSRGGAGSEAITHWLQSEVFILMRKKKWSSYHVLSECCHFIPLEQKKKRIKRIFWYS